MPLKDRLRRAIRTDRSFSGSSSSHSGSRVGTATNTPGTSGAATPTPSQSHRNSDAAPPTLTLTKTHTSGRLSLSKTLTWSRDKRSKEEKMAEKQQKRLEYWEEKDKLEWSTPEDGWRRTGKKRSKQHQDMLRTFEFDCSTRRSMGSWISGISPGQSRVGSVDSSEEDVGKTRKRSSGAGAGAGVGGSALSREVAHEDEENPLGHAVASVAGE